MTPHSALRTPHSEPVYTVKVAFTHRPVGRCVGTDGLLRFVPTLPPDLYAIDEDGEPWGSATVSAYGLWEIDGESFKAGPGYIIV